MKSSLLSVLIVCLLSSPGATDPPEIDPMDNVNRILDELVSRQFVWEVRVQNLEERVNVLFAVLIERNSQDESVVPSRTKKRAGLRTMSDMRYSSLSSDVQGEMPEMQLHRGLF